MSGLPEPKVARLLDECIKRMNDFTRPIDIFTLHRFMRGFQEALPNAPEELLGDLHGAIGACLARLRRPEQALEEYRAAARLDPGSAGRENDIATILFDLGRHDEGLRHLRTALSLPTADLPMRLVLRLNEALVLAELGDEVAARTVFDAASRDVAPTDTENNLRLAKNAAQLGYESDAATFFARYLVADAGMLWDEDASIVEVIRDHHERASVVLAQLSRLADVVRHLLADEADEDARDAEDFRAALAEFTASGESPIPFDEVLAGHGLTRADLSG